MLLFGKVEKVGLTVFGFPGFETVAGKEMGYFPFPFARPLNGAKLFICLFVVFNLYSSHFLIWVQLQYVS